MDGELFEKNLVGNLNKKSNRNRGYVCLLVVFLNSFIA